MSIPHRPDEAEVEIAVLRTYRERARIARNGSQEQYDATQKAALVAARLRTEFGYDEARIEREVTAA